MTTAYSDVRPSPIAGTWYPAHSENLAKMVDGFLAAANPTPPTGRIVGLLTPHAGLQYSGPVAAYAFKLLQTLKPDTVAVLCPYHRPPPHLYAAQLVTTEHEAFQTPLGVIPVDREAVAALEKLVPLATTRRDGEHALEIELPFLQRVLPAGFKLLPIMLIEQSPQVTEALGHALAQIFTGRNVILVASSDLSHFFPQDDAVRLDQATLDHVRAFEPRGVLSSGRMPGEGACGKGAIASVMWAARDLGADSAEVLHYATSGDTSGDYRQVVGYGAGVFYQRQ